MLSGKVDATLGGFWNVEGVELKRRAARSRGSSLSTGSGVPRLRRARAGRELGQARRAARRPAPVRRRHRARGERGAQGPARRRPARCSTRTATCREKTTAASVRLTIPTLFPPSGKPWGYLDPVAWRNYGGWMVDNGVLDELPDIPEAITNDLLPGEGLSQVAQGPCAANGPARARRRGTTSRRPRCGAGPCAGGGPCRARRRLRRMRTSVTSTAPAVRPPPRRGHRARAGSGSASIRRRAALGQRPHRLRDRHGRVIQRAVLSLGRTRSPESTPRERCGPARPRTSRRSGSA